MTNKTASTAAPTPPADSPAALAAALSAAWHAYDCSLRHALARTLLRCTSNAAADRLLIGARTHDLGHEIFENLTDVIAATHGAIGEALTTEFAIRRSSELKRLDDLDPQDETRQ
jgi:hypothetical protein